MPAVGISAPLFSTKGAGVPMTQASLRRAYFWAGDGKPGARGSVLIGLHSNRRGWAVGNRLPRLRKGAELRLETKAGETLTYRVTRSTPRAPLRLSERKVAQLRSNVGPSQLVLTTCNKWALGSDGNYRYRSLAIAKLVTS